MTSNFRIKGFLHDQSAASATIFAVALVPLSLAVAAAVDLSQAQRYRTALDAAADSAALAGVSRSIYNGSLGSDAQKRLSESTAISVFQAEAVKAGATVKSSSALFTAASNGGSATVEVKYSASFPSVMGNLAFSSTNVSGRAIANGSVNFASYTQMYLLLDTSASMGIGVDLATQAAMKRDPDMQGCAFACHDPGNDTAVVARRKGYKLRFDSVKEQLDVTLADISNQFGGLSNPKLQLAIYGFDNGFRQISALGSNIAQHRQALSGADFTYVGGGTSLRNALVELKKVISTPGDGSSSSKPKVVVLLVTDAVVNSVEVFSGGRWGASPTAYPAFTGKLCWNQTIPPANGPWYPPTGAPSGLPCVADSAMISRDVQEIGPLNPAWCTDLKNYGVKLLTLYSRYDFPQPTGSPTDIATREWRNPQMYYYVVPALQNAMSACATSPSDSYIAYDAASIQAGVTKLIKEQLPLPMARLTK